MSIATNKEAKNGHVVTSSPEDEITQWYAEYTKRESNGETDKGVKLWKQSSYDQAISTALSSRRDLTVVPEFAVDRVDAPSLAASLKIIRFDRPNLGSTLADISLVLITRDPSRKEIPNGLEVLPIDNIKDLTKSRPEVISGLANVLREAARQKPFRKV